MRTCPLCRLEHKTAWHYEGVLFIIVDCLRCGIPMWVQRPHGILPHPSIKKSARHMCRRLFGENIRFSGPETILEHYHEHVHLP